jgi:YVTN family beta-propeller protein
MTTDISRRLRAGAAGLFLIIGCLIELGCAEPAPPEVTNRFKSYSHVPFSSYIVVATYASSNAPVLLRPPDETYDWSLHWSPIGNSGWSVTPLQGTGYSVNSEGQLLYEGKLAYPAQASSQVMGSKLAPRANAQTSPQYVPQPAPLLYKTGANTNTVVVLDPSSTTVVATIPVGTHPRGLAGTPDGKQVWVANMNSSSISVIDASSLKVTATIPLPASQPYGIDITPDGTTAYVASGTTPGAVYAVDVARQTVTSTISVGGRPFKLAVSPDGAQVYVTNNADGTVSVIDVLTNTVIQTITVGAAAFGVAFAPNGTRVYVTANGNLCVIDPSNFQIVATVAVGVYPVSVTVDPTGTEAFVCNRLSTFISHIDLTTNQLIENIPVGFSPETAVLVP